MSNDSIPDGDFTYSNLLMEPWNEQTYFLESALSNSSINKAESQQISEVFSDEVLDYIKQMLLDEAIDDSDDALQSHPDLEATEKHLYELIGGENPTQNSVFASIDFFHSNSDFASYQNCDFYASFGFHEDRFADLPSEQARRKQTRLSDESGDEESARKSKQPAFSSDEVVPSVEVEKLLLCSGDEFREIVNTTRENLHKEASLDSKLSRKSLSKKQAKEDEEEHDVNTLLLHCAQTVAIGDTPRARELLKQIRRNSSPFGDASQRLAHYFADGIEARLAGTGSELYNSIVCKRKTLVDVSIAYKLYLTCCPFKKIAYHFANQTILNTIQSSNRVHILDFGIFFGFQWPIFIKLLSLRPNGPPKLRITGIDAPQPGFRPSEMVEETGLRLSDYASRFGVPFEYHGIAAKFDEIKASMLRIEEEETLIVNCLFRLHSPADETAVEDCARDKVLRFIRKLNPAVFVNVVMNGTYGAPFFMTRIRAALYHFAAVFDMIDKTTPKQSERRMVVERDLYGRMLINAISCEGLERERPETYKQWQARCVRAGLEMVKNRKGFVRRVKDGVREIYHRDFHMDEDGRWLLIGWKGRIFFGMSAWKPARL